MDKPTAREVAWRHRELRHHDIMYRRGEPEIFDHDYDAMYEQLKAWEQRWPELVTPDSPTQTVETVDDGTEEHWYAPLSAEEYKKGRYIP